MADTQAPPALPRPPVNREARPTRPTAQRWLAAAAWVGGIVALGALYLRISRSSFVDSDGANNSLQAWDLLHGHLLLHGWLIGDANFYFLELPVNALTEAVFGLGNFAAHAGSALTYLIVTVVTAVVAVTGSRGSARAVRCAVVVIGARGAAAHPPVHALRARGARPHGHLRLHPRVVPADRPGGRAPVHRAAAVRAVVRGRVRAISTVTYVAVPSIVARVRRPRAGGA